MECQSLRESGKELKKFEVAYFTASTCTQGEAEKFAKSLELDYPILADEDSKVAEEYGTVTEQRKLPHRYTFYISKDGKIAAIDKEVKPKGAGRAVAKKLTELKVDPKKSD